MQKKEHKIGETFHCGTFHLKCVKATKGQCVGCFFQNNISCIDLDLICIRENMSERLGFCNRLFREDMTDVIFVKVEE